MAIQFYIAKTKDDYDKVVAYDRKSGLLTHSKDRSEMIKVAYIIDDKHYDYFITTINRLKLSGADYIGKENKKIKKEKPKKKERRYSMVFYKKEEVDNG